MNSEKIRINLGFATSKQSLHELLAAVLGFPDYYGMNWDAFWDCIRDPEQSNMPNQLELSGISRLEMTLPQDAQQLRQIIKDLESEQVDFKVWLSD